MTSSFDSSEKIIEDTIFAQATAIGSAGVGIIRISGSLTKQVAIEVLGKVPKIRYAEYLPFYNIDKSILDYGIALFFKAPNSFTGEDVLELQGHGGQIILDILSKRIATINGVRLAKPGEFSKRAFLNDKLDLAQAEAIADLITATSERAALSAIRSLQGEFSNKINELVEEITYLRTYIEAAIDFSDEDIDFLSHGRVQEKILYISDTIKKIGSVAKQGSILREGMKVVIVGKPNAGKSSLLNVLAEKEIAIVSSIAGTTRDVLQEYINIDGMPLHFIDTAGLRANAEDEIEKIGIKKALHQMHQADLLLLVVDAATCSLQELETLKKELLKENLHEIPTLIIYNKIDLVNLQHRMETINNTKIIYTSTETKEGLLELKDYLKHQMGYLNNVEGVFIARRRHLQSLSLAQEQIQDASDLLANNQALELIAENLRLAQNFLGEITGKITSDDLLTNIFSSFCIGK